MSYRTCSEPGCESACANSRAWCYKHYNIRRKAKRQEASK